MAVARGQGSEAGERTRAKVWKVWVEMVEAVWREAQTPTFNDLSTPGG